MPIDQSIDPLGRFVLLRYATEEPTPQETEQAVLGILSDPALPSNIGILFDRRALPAAPTAERVRGLVAGFALRAELFRGRRIAVVYAGQATFGMVRMAELLAIDIPVTIEIFATIEEAEAWLRAT